MGATANARSPWNAWATRSHARRAPDSHRARKSAVGWHANEAGASRAAFISAIGVSVHGAAAIRQSAAHDQHAPDTQLAVCHSFWFLSPRLPHGYCKRDATLTGLQSAAKRFERASYGTSWHSRSDRPVALWLLALLSQILAWLLALATSSSFCPSRPASRVPRPSSTEGKRSPVSPDLLVACGYSRRS